MYLYGLYYSLIYYLFKVFGLHNIQTIFMHFSVDYSKISANIIIIINTGSTGLPA